MLHPVFAWALIFGVAASSLHVLCEAGRRTAVRGSRPRYIFASWERALRWPAMLYWIVSAVVEQQVFGDWFLFTTSCFGGALWLVLYWDKRKNGEDDDFWTDAKKKVTKWLARRSTSPAFAPSA